MTEETPVPLRRSPRHSDSPPEIIQGGNKDKTKAKIQDIIREKSKPKPKKESETEYLNAGNGSRIIPEELKIYVSQEMWNSWSPIRRNSFIQILNNPNTFFYRNRPPGDPQINGQFTEEEEKQFIERLHYFRNDLGIEDGAWGLFAVPIRGRLGYQCANFYRSLILAGKVKDDRYRIVEGKLSFSFGDRKPISDSAMIKLKNEAIEFVNKFIKSNDDVKPKMVKPVQIIMPQKEKKIEKEKNIGVEKHNNKEKERVKAKDIGKEKDKKKEKMKPKDTNIKNVEDKVGEKGVLKKKVKEKEFEKKRDKGENSTSKDLISKKRISNNEILPVKRQRRMFLGESDNKCPLVGAWDPISGIPIKVPMINESGYVMDISSWETFFSGKSDLPFHTNAQSESDLIEVTKYNFSYIRRQIVNIPC